MWLSGLLDSVTIITRQRQELRGQPYYVNDILMLISIGLIQTNLKKTRRV